MGRTGDQVEMLAAMVMVRFSVTKLMCIFALVSISCLALLYKSQEYCFAAFTISCTC